MGQELLPAIVASVRRFSYECLESALLTKGCSEAGLAEKITSVDVKKATRIGQKNGCSELNTRYNYFPLSVRGDLAPQPGYFFFFFFAAFFFVAIERLLESLGPDSDPVIFLMPRTRSHSEYCGTDFALSTEKCIFAYHDQQENIMYTREKLGLMRGIGYVIALALLILFAVWRVIPHSH
jgi:hypothetical protein